MPPVDLRDRPSDCAVENDKRIFALQDLGTHSKATVDVGTRKCQKIQIDGALHEIQPIKCDWCIRDKANGECLFVELKGNDCVHAANQICNTIQWFKNNTRPFLLHQYAYIVARSGIPKANTQIQLVITRLAKKHSVILQCKHTPAQLKF